MVYREDTLDDEYVITTQNLTFPKYSPTQVALTLYRIFEDLKSASGSIPKVYKPIDPYKTSSIYTPTLSQDIISDKYWDWYFPNYPNEIIIF
jgi:hypothetical protein